MCTVSQSQRILFKNVGFKPNHNRIIQNPYKINETKEEDKLIEPKGILFSKCEINLELEKNRKFRKSLKSSSVPSKRISDNVYPFISALQFCNIAGISIGIIN
ncbi:hypothetical protein ACFFRR_007816 [Megaselia abdita]